MTRQLGYVVRLARKNMWRHRLRTLLTIAGIAIARALVADPSLIVADEPTGDLDRHSANEVLNLLDRLNGELGKTIVMVTHDPKCAARAKRQVHLEKGLLLGEDATAGAAGAAGAVH